MSEILEFNRICEMCGYDEAMVDTNFIELDKETFSEVELVCPICGFVSGRSVKRNESGEVILDDDGHPIIKAYAYFRPPSGSLSYTSNVKKEAENE